MTQVIIIIIQWLDAKPDLQSYNTHKTANSTELLN